MSTNVQPAVLIEPKGEGNFFEDLTRDYHAGRPIWREISREDYWYARDAVPPLDDNGSDFLLGAASRYTETDVIYSGFVQVVCGNDEQRWEQFYAREIGRSQFQAAAAELRRYLFKGEAV